MVDLQTSAPAISAAAAPPYSITRTRPDELRRHDISDEELGILYETRRDYLWEGMWVAAGVALGAAPTCATALISVILKDTEKTFPIGDVVQVVIFFVAIAVFGVLCYSMRNKTRNVRDLVTAIRERTRQSV